jgi:hypothetical protein
LQADNGTVHTKVSSIVTVAGDERFAEPWVGVIETIHIPS